MRTDTGPPVSSAGESLLRSLLAKPLGDSKYSLSATDKHTKPEVELTAVVGFLDSRGEATCPSAVEGVTKSDDATVDIYPEPLCF